MKEQPRAETVAHSEPPTYEKTVKEIRAALRAGNHNKAHQLFNPLSKTLVKKITWSAEASLGRYGRELSDDGIREAIVLLWTRVSCLDGKPGTQYFEQRFNAAFAKLLLDAFKSVRTRKYGLTEKNGSWEKLDAERAPSDAEDAPENLVYDLCAVNGKTVFYSGLDNSDDSTPTADRLLSRIPNPKWAEALQMEIDGCGRDEIAAHFGTSVKTIYNWTEKAKAALKAHLLATYPLDPQGRPILAALSAR